MIIPFFDFLQRTFHAFDVYDQNEILIDKYVLYSVYCTVYIHKH